MAAQLSREVKVLQQGFNRAREQFSARKVAASKERSDFEEAIKLDLDKFKKAVSEKSSAVGRAVTTGVSNVATDLVEGIDDDNGGALDDYYS